MSLKTWMIGCWQSRQREIDIDILWPIICKNSRDVEHARKAFALHAENDGAWASMSDEERRRKIDSLPYIGEAA